MDHTGTKPSKEITKPGYVNRNGQVVIRNTGLPGTDHVQTIYQLACSHCGHNYGANGSDIFERKCQVSKGQAGTPARIEKLKQQNRAAKSVPLLLKLR